AGPPMDADQQSGCRGHAAAPPAVKHDATLPVSDPLVSVIVTCFNYAEFVADAVQSVHAQTHQRFECIVVDDCSSDETPAVVTAVLDELKDARFRSVRLPRNVGQLGARRDAPRGRTWVRARRATRGHSCPATWSLSLCPSLDHDLARRLSRGT